MHNDVLREGISPMSKAITVTSLALNVAALCALGWIWQRNETALLAAGSAPPSEARIVQLQSALRGAGLEELQAWHAVGAMLQTPVNGLTEYWKPNIASIRSRTLAQYEDLLRAREAVRTSAGDGAIYDPRFAPLFRPYQADLDFLPPEQQMALQAIEMKQLEASPAGITMHQTGTDHDVDAQIKSLLSAEHWKEYQYRRSPLRQRLLATGFDFSEYEYRAVFDVVSAASTERNLAFSAGAIGNPRLDSRLSSQIQDALGEQRFATFRKVQDPNYVALLHAARSHNLAAATIDAAYEIVVQNTVDRQRIGRSLAPDPARIERDAQLRRILGPQAFEQFSKLSPGYGPNQVAAFIGR